MCIRDRFETVVMLPPNVAVLKKLLSTDYPPGVATISGDSGITVGFFLRRKEQLPPTDPRTQSMIKKLLRERFPKDKVKEATDPKFVGFMNQSLGNRVDTPGLDPLADAPDWYRDAPVQKFDADSSWGGAALWGLRILARVEPDVRAALKEAGEDAIVEYLRKVAEATGAYDKFDFAEEDIWECQDYLDEIFHDPTITSWTQVI